MHEQPSEDWSAYHKPSNEEPTDSSFLALWSQFLKDHHTGQWKVAYRRIFNKVVACYHKDYQNVDWGQCLARTLSNACGEEDLDLGDEQHNEFLDYINDLFEIPPLRTPPGTDPNYGDTW
jgi:hypothetical protein